MAEYRSQADIGNRALQHCGAIRMGSAGFSENSKNASEVSFCYGKLRQAELRRNVWSFACRRTILRAIDTDTMLLDAALWSSATTYFVGSIVTDQYGNLWQSTIRDNLNNDPLNFSSYWEPYFGPLTVDQYDSDNVYHSGELVYTASGNGTNRVYLSLQDDNSDNPATATQYDAMVTYFKNEVVTYSSVAYMSRIDLNLNNQPDLTPADWASGTTYAAGNTVTGSDGIIYSSIGSGNLGHDPTLDTGIYWTDTGVQAPWTTDFVGGTGSLKWLQVGGAEFPSGVGLTTLNLIYPIGTGPSTHSLTRNVYKMPAGFLREASQNPKAGVTTFLGGPTGILYNDWVHENGYLLSSEVGPIAYRFVADITDVTKMDAMFCEGLAARVALEVCEMLTQSTSKLGAIAKMYDVFMTEARAVNAIEQGAEQPPDDDYVTCRL
jgi:hypothetical protein